MSRVSKIKGQGPPPLLRISSRLRGAGRRRRRPDLQTWTYRGPFCAGEPEPVGDRGLLTGEGWECPQYLPAADGRGALILSAWYERDGPHGVLALAGEDRGDVFEAGPPQLLDHGPDFYAPALLRAPGGRWLLWGWSWEARTQEWSETEGWAGTLTLPREIELTEDGRTYQRPAAELLALRGERTVHAAGLASDSTPMDLGEVSRSFDLTAHLEAAGKAGLRLVTAPDEAEYLDILLDADAGQLVVNRDHASLDPRARGGTYTMPCPSGQPVDLRVVVDHSIAEIFLSTGQVLTLRFYPVGEHPWHLQAHAAPGAQLTYTIDAWQLLPLEIKQSGIDTPNAKGRAA